MKPEEIIKEARERKGFTQTELAEKLGIGLRMYQKIESGQFPKYKKEQIQLLDRILNTNIYELIYEHKSTYDIPLNSGNTPNAYYVGEPIGPYERNGNQFIELSSGLFKLKTKIVSQKARAGYLTGWGDPEYLENLPDHEVIVDRPVSGEYLCFEVGGDSMDDGTSDSIRNADIITGRKVNRHLWINNKLHIDDYKAFIIVCNTNINNEGGILVKKIIEHNTKENYIICHSINPDKDTYPDFKINIIDIMQVFNVVKVERKY